MPEQNLPKEIHKKKLLVAEGKDDVQFFVKLLDMMNITDFLVWPLGGKDRFNIDLIDLKKVRGYDDLTHFAVVRDKDADNAFKSVQNIMKRKMRFQNVPLENGQFVHGHPKVGIFVMPGNTIKGTMLEDLCLKTVEKHPAISCVEEFASCVSGLDDPPKILPKVKVQAFLAAQPEIVNTVGLGAEKKYWYLSSPHLDELKKFLNNFK